MARKRIDYGSLMRLREAEGEHGATMVADKLIEALNDDSLPANERLQPEDFALRGLAEAICGHDWVAALDPRRGGGGFQKPLTEGEAIDAVRVSAFSNITGQIAYSAIKKAYDNPAFLGDQLVTTIPTSLSGEKIPGISNITKAGGTDDGVPDGTKFPEAGVSEDWIETPATTKRGLIVSVTKEAVFFDRTGQLLTNCSKVGEWLGTQKEKRILDVVLGIVNPFKWKGTTYNTYQTATPWINVKASNELVDWTQVEAAEQLFVGLTDPFTGEPIVIMPDTMIVMPAKKYTALRVTRATEISTQTNVANNVPATKTISANPVQAYNLLSSALLKARAAAASIANADKLWLLGQPKKAFAYMENWPITVIQAPPNSDAEFERDIIARWRASERGAAAVQDPRFMVQCTG